MLPCIELTPSPPPAESVIALVDTSCIICVGLLVQDRLFWVVPAAVPSLSESEVALLLGGVDAGSRHLVVLAVDPLTPPDRLLLAVLTFALYLFFYESQERDMFWAISHDVSGHSTA